MFNWCARNDVKYITGMPAIGRFGNCAKPYINQAKNLFIKSEKNKKFLVNLAMVPKVGKMEEGEFKNWTQYL